MSRAKRVFINTDVVINKTIMGEGLDISEGGMYVYSRTPLTPETIVELSFDLDGEYITLEGLIRHLQPGIGFGLKFVDMPKEAADKIKGYLLKSGG